MKLEGIKVAEKEIIRFVHRRHFGEELIPLRKRKPLKPCNIIKLDPFNEDEYILRIYGRIQRSTLTNEIQHPVFLPKCCRIAALVVHSWHELVTLLVEASQ